MNINDGQFNEDDLIAAIRKGDGKALQVIFKLYHSRLCATAFRMVQDREVAKDIVQEVFIRFWEKHTALPGELDVKSYLYRSTINGALNHLKKTKQIRQDSLEGIKEIPEPHLAESNLYVHDLQTSLTHCVERLPPVCRTVFMLSRFDDMSNGQIAGHLQISLKSVEKHMTKALKYLRSALRGQHE
jgi:RNA polymerase sigma-70 factor (ECF subfamily)